MVEPPSPGPRARNSHISPHMPLIERPLAAELHSLNSPACAEFCGQRQKAHGLRPGGRVSFVSYILMATMVPDAAVRPAITQMAAGFRRRRRPAPIAAHRRRIRRFAIVDRPPRARVRQIGWAMSPIAATSDQVDLHDHRRGPGEALVDAEQPGATRYIEQKTLREPFARRPTLESVAYSGG